MPVSPWILKTSALFNYTRLLWWWTPCSPSRMLTMLLRSQGRNSPGVCLASFNKTKVVIKWCMTFQNDLNKCCYGGVKIWCSADFNMSLFGDILQSVQRRKKPPSPASLGTEEPRNTPSQRTGDCAPLWGAIQGKTGKLKSGYAAV